MTRQSLLVVCSICVAIHWSFAAAFSDCRQHSGAHNHGAKKGMVRCYQQQQRSLPSKHPWKRVFIRGGQQSPLPASSTHVQSSTLTTPPTKQPSLTSRVITSFIRLLFKGMTLPFPMLREIVDDTSNGKAALGFSLRECLVAIFAYLCLGTLAYSVVLEKWSLVDSIYFSVVTFTSVGYGDLTPSTLSGKLFTCLFGLSGLAFLGVAISTIASSLLGKDEEFLKAAEEASRNRIKNVFEGMPHVVKKLRSNESMGGTNGAESTSSTKHTNDKIEEHTPMGWRSTVQKAVLKLIPSLSFLLVGGMIMARIEGWRWPDSVYYSIITGSTIGFGDFFPKTPMGRMWGIFFIPLAVAAAGDVLGNVGSSLVERRQARVFRDLMNRDITMDNLLTMDEDGSGKVSREEYVRFMLTEMGLVESKEFDELYAQFKRLDADGSGTLDKADLRLMAKHRSKTSRSKSAQQAS